MARILVIRLGALGDFVQSFAPFATIRAHHAHDVVGLLTQEALAGLGRQAPWFDHVLVDRRPPWHDLRAVLALRRVLRSYDFIYDLQTSGRSTRYLRLSGLTAWSGIGRGGQAVHDNPQRRFMHTRARQRDQLRRAGLESLCVPDLSWLAAGGPVLPAPYGVLVPGAAAHRPAKRWPVARYAALAVRMAEGGLLPVVVGGKGEGVLAATIRAACPTAVDLTGRTTLPELGGVLARARCAVGNDTGPMHMAAALGVPCTVLFSADSNPALTAPVGQHAGQVKVIYVRDLATVRVDRVAATLG
ncbi:ADP-heptose--LPS heptosyltransferase [Komagataeibacter rhaeticus]|uniref:glycosyltransferase family 9 protein n=1 Tax=Komagataeibacter rhaeticus TaxID=215221 RepID=UPI0004D9DA7D|nr:glycosyltransferase family 9 protein [Komagataeibacter rhaeticus]KDU97083.1 glycosyl transferase [Komagataeibacter rhaeticus AF1]MBL7240415.1 glycosyltransferase family 9 protein [Komagataeibacter rhaeticus]PYD53772.1 ADP-heptose--LPS heptosyltransferase [Komagataeibacter rhaeticus]GBQ10334.1 lipopolysaccharide heptosyltransferase [Komagataeibacter rhaeticus DSM 16663]